MVPIFELEDVSLSYELAGGARNVLRNISFTVSDGEILTFCGASGTGKTSLLRIMAGLTRQTGGTANFRGAPIDGPANDVAIVFQDYSNALLQWRTVGRNVALGIERTLKGTELKDRVMDALRLVGLEKNVNDYPWQLSGGMQQRVQIARALALKPSVLLMDEPFAALDAMTKASLQDELLNIRDKTGANIVFITHDIEEAVYLGDRVAVLRGTPSTVEQLFDIALPKPRNQITTRELPEFLALRHQIHDAIGGHS
ncbi:MULTISPECIES: ABC transporter ATP-binding protein [Chelativorans]|jgi:NitT/TauT family transport system ATP-binding protein|uniref:ABC transporter related protein n=1 Tax=Chelativorans sp. (strain BNC1) TaxID=266779 RepID=Q11CG3_CHESB|nr:MULTISPECIES: ABC transporter ATP-binding protein [Chelativorans]